jgi:hypothetical protein
MERKMKEPQVVRDSQKKLYNKPSLTNFGDIARITNSVGNHGLDDVGGSAGHQKTH